MKAYIVLTFYDEYLDSMVGFAPIYTDKEAAARDFPGCSYVEVEMPYFYTEEEEEYGEAVAREGEEEQQLFQALAEGDL